MIIVFVLLILGIDKQKISYDVVLFQDWSQLYIQTALICIAKKFSCQVIIIKGLIY